MWNQVKKKVVKWQRHTIIQILMATTWFGDNQEKEEEKFKGLRWLFS